MITKRVDGAVNQAAGEELRKRCPSCGQLFRYVAVERQNAPESPKKAEFHRRCGCGGSVKE